MRIEALDASRDSARRLANLEARIVRLRERMTSTTQQLEFTAKGTAARDKMAEYVAALEELEQALTAEVIRVEREQIAADAILDQLPPKQARVVRLRYEQGLSWRRVARQVGVSESHVFYLHREAVKAYAALQKKP